MNDKYKVSIITLGCDKNRVDSEVMAGILKSKGYSLVLDQEKADFIIINTCTFINEARKETKETINRALTYNAKVILAGCHIQRFKDGIVKEFPRAQAFLGINNIEDIDKIIERVKKDEIVKSFGDPVFLYTQYNKRLLSTPKGSAFIKIGEGCNHNCTFCIIPKIKGKLRSRTIENIIEETEYLASLGVKEINLVTQDLNSYGIDKYGRSMIRKLVEKISEIEGIEWIRLLYMYPFNFPYEILDLMKENKKICKYIDLPLQHINNTILKKMGRKSRRKDIEKLIDEIRSKIPDIVIRTSFIVGFPGEGEDEFYELKDFLEQQKFQWVGVFLYSREEGTYASNMKNQVSEEVKIQRKNSLMALQKRITDSLNKKRVGKQEDVLIEREENGLLIGRTRKEAPEVDGKIYLYRGKREYIGKIKRVQIINSNFYDLKGIFIE